MGNFSGYIPVTYVNGSTPAINADNLNKNENMIDIVAAELNYSASWSLKPIMLQCRYENTKDVENFNRDYTDWTDVGTVTLSNAYDAVFGKGLKLTETDNSAAQIRANLTLSSTLDLTSFNSGRSSTVDDSIVLVVNVSDDTKFASIAIDLGDDASNTFYYEIAGANLDTGINEFNLIKDDFSVTGSPTGWDNIDYISCAATTNANASGESVTFSLIQLNEYDDSEASSTPWFFDDGNGNFDELPYMIEASNDSIIYFDSVINKLAFCPTYTSVYFKNEILCTVNSFSLKAEIYSKSDGYGASLVWYIDDDNLLEIRIAGSDLEIYETVATTPSTVATESLDSSIVYGDRMELYVDKKEDIIRVVLAVDGQGIKTVAWETSFDADEEGCLAFTKFTSSQYYVVTDFVVGANHALLPPFNAGATILNYKKDDESLASNNSLTDREDEDLTVKLPPNSCYEVEVTLSVDGTDSGQDIKVDWVTSGCSSVSLRNSRGPGTGTASVADSDSFRSSAGGYATDLGFGVVNAGWTYANERAIVYTGNSGGTVEIRWCQNSSSATAITLKAGSCIKATRIY
jgi:hypothetical protein